jgi:SAM-dependent methyltransferase
MPVDLEALTDLRTPWCIHTAVTLRIAEHLEAGPMDIEALAAVAACDADALHRMLTHLVSKGLFEQPAPGRFALNAAAERIRDATPFLDLDGIGGRLAGAWSTLPAWVRTGEPAYARQFGLPFWEDLAADPHLAASFDDLIGPGGHGTPDARLELADGWDGVAHVVDVGGGTGAMLTELLRRHPGLRGTLVDLPGTVARAAEVDRAPDVAARLAFAGQSFFDPLPAGADLYVIRHVLNDWPERETVAILRRCAEAARPGGRVAVLGGVAPDDAPRHLVIEMVLVGGRTSTLAEFRAQAREAGLEVVAAGRQAIGEFVVECRPV